MANFRGHEPVVIEEFNGLWRRGDADSVPIDHFSDCNNIQYIESGFETRDGLDTLIAKNNVVRMYNYRMQTGESLLLLDNNGDIYHALLDGSNTVYGPILSIAGMTDFGFVAVAGRAYITHSLHLQMEMALIIKKDWKTSSSTFILVMGMPRVRLLAFLLLIVTILHWSHIIQLLME